MKRLVLITATALLGACASTPTTNATTTASAETTNAYGREVDARQVNAINRVARVNGVDVHWLNYPELKPSPGAAGPAPAPTGT